MSYRIGKKNFIKAKSTIKKIVISLDTPVLEVDGKYIVMCECGGIRHISIMEINLLESGAQPRFKCSKCKVRHYNIKDIYGVIKKENKPPNNRINKELAVIMLNSGLTIKELICKYGVSYNGVMKVFRDHKNRQKE